MLSIGAMSGGQGEYYLQLAKEDYYLSGGEPEGRWLGRGREKLELPETVTPQHLRTLFQGFSPRGIPLVKNAGSENRQPGWDLTFSAPKSVSVLWSQASEEIRQVIQAAHDRAVVKAIEYLEQHASFSRTGRGGVESLPCSLLVAAFQHGTSRELDPQLHTHALVLNIGIDEKGVSRTVMSKPLYQHKMTAGAIYRSELASQLLRELKVKIRVEKNLFQIDGIPEEILRHFSKRRAEIVAELAERGATSAAAAAVATLATRKTKGTVPPRSELFAKWQGEGQALGWEKILPQVLGHSTVRFNKIPTRVIGKVVRTLVNENGHFTKAELVRRVARLALKRGIDSSATVKGVETYLAKRRIQSLGSDRTTEYFTTKQSLANEKKLLQRVERLSRMVLPPLREHTIQAACEKRYRPNPQRQTAAKIIQQRLRGELRKSIQLSKEQQQALRHMTQSPGRIKAVEGWAGTGKTTLLNATRQAFKKEGYEVLGCTLSAIAAKNLEQGSGIQSDTLAMRLRQLRPSAASFLKHEAKQVLRTMQGKPRYEQERLKLTPKTVVVLDEAGMVGTKDFARLVKEVAKQGAILICVGDTKQLTAIEAGGTFHAIIQKIGSAELSQISRQRDVLDREAVKSLAEGKPHEALKHYERKGQLTVAKTKAEAQQALVEAYKQCGGLANPKEHVVFVGKKEDAANLNRLIQEERRQAGQLGNVLTAKVGPNTLRVGDRVLCEKNSRLLDVQNGTTGTVVNIRVLGLQKSLVVKIDGTNERRILPLRDYPHVKLAYAFTTHKLQGSTVENAYVHLDKSMTNRELAYVQGSRHRGQLQLFTEQVASSKSPKLSQSLLSKMARSEAKEMAQVVKERLEKEYQKPIEPGREHSRTTEAR